MKILFGLEHRSKNGVHAFFGSQSIFYIIEIDANIWKSGDLTKKSGSSFKIGKCAPSPESVPAIGWSLGFPLSIAHPLPN